MKIDSAPRSGISPLPEAAGEPGADVAAPPSRLPETGETDADVAAPLPQLPEGLDETKGAAEQPPWRPDSVDKPDTGVAAPPRAAVKPRRQQLPPRARRWIVLAIAAVAIAFLFAVRGVVQPFIWAAVVAYILNPVVGALQKRLGRRGFGVAVVMIVLIASQAWLISAALPTLRADIAALTSTLDLFNTYLTNTLPNAGTLSVLGIPVQAAQLVHNAQATITDLPRVILHSGWSVATTTVDTLLRFLTFLISTVYLLLDAPRLGRWACGRIPPRYRDETILLARQIDTVLTEYLRAEIILIAIMSTASLLALTLLGMRFAFILAPIVGFLEIFPIIGPFFAIATVALVALISPPNFGLQHGGYAVVVALVFFVMRQVEDYLVIPNVVGHAVKLHPVLILFALLCGATLGGILGMFLAVPVTGALKVLGNYTYDRLVA